MDTTGNGSGKTGMDLDQQRRQVLEEMLRIGSMERGALSEQYFKARRRGQHQGVRQGPYYVLSRWIKGKNRSKRIPREDVARTREDLLNYRRFQGLCKQFVELTEQLAQRERQQATSEEALKRGLKRRSRRAGKSNA